MRVRRRMRRVIAAGTRQAAVALLQIAVPPPPRPLLFALLQTPARRHRAVARGRPQNHPPAQQQERCENTRRLRLRCCPSDPPQASLRRPLGVAAPQWRTRRSKPAPQLASALPHCPAPQRRVYSAGWADSAALAARPGRQASSARPAWRAPLPRGAATGAAVAASKALRPGGALTSRSWRLRLSRRPRHPLRPRQPPPARASTALRRAAPRQSHLRETR